MHAQRFSCHANYTLNDRNFCAATLNFVSQRRVSKPPASILLLSLLVGGEKVFYSRFNLDITKTTETTTTATTTH